jgi:hypothetical protein
MALRFNVGDTSGDMDGMAAGSSPTTSRPYMRLCCSTSTCLLSRRLDSQPCRRSGSVSEPDALAAASPVL